MREERERRRKLGGFSIERMRERPKKERAFC